MSNKIDMGALLKVKVYNQLHEKHCATYCDIQSAKLHAQNLMFAKENFNLRLTEECFDLTVKCSNGTLYAGFELVSKQFVSSIFDKIVDCLANGYSISNGIGYWEPIN